MTWPWVALILGAVGLFFALLGFVAYLQSVQARAKISADTVIGMHAATEAASAIKRAGEQVLRGGMN